MATSTLEYEEGYCKKVRGRLALQGLSNWATVHRTDSLEFLRKTDIKFDFGFFDSLTELRPQEYHICRERNLIGQVAAFHDTSKYRVDEWTKPEVQQEYREKLFEIAKGPGVTGYLDSNLSRGLFVVYHEI